MKWIANTLSRYAIAFAILGILSMALPILKLPELSIDNSIEVWLRQDSTEFKDYETFKKRHGSDEFILIAVSGTDILAEENLTVMDQVAEELEELKNVESVTSISHIPDFMMDEFINILISEDMSVGGILVNCDPLEGKSARRDMVQGVKDILDPHRGTFDFHIGGAPVMNVALDATSERESKVFFPIAFAISAVILILTTRSFMATLIAAASATVTVVWTLGIMAACGKSFNMVTLVIPTLLWVLSLSNCIHLIHTYRKRLSEGEDKDSALHHTLSMLIAPCFTASFTTAVGFSTLAVSHMTPIRDLGIFSAVGIMIALLANMTVTPGLLRLCIRAKRMPTQSPTPDHAPRFSSFSGFIGKHRHVVATVALLLVAGSGSLTFLLDVESNVLKFFRDDAQVVRDYRFISDNLTGLSTIEIDTTADNDEAVAAHEEFVNNIADELGELPGVSAVRVDETESSTRISAFVNVMESRKFNDLVEQTKATIDTHQPEHVSVLTTGTVLLLNNVQEELIDTQIRSFALAFLCIFVVLAIMFRSLKIMLVSLLPNILPVFTTFGIMSLLKIPLDTGTITIASIAIGIAVDDTIHFLSRIGAEQRQGDPLDQAVGRAFEKAAPPILFTSLVIASGFFALCFAQFRPLMLFGLLSGIAMLSALVGDLVFLPALVLLLKPRFRNRNE